MATGTTVRTLFDYDDFEGYAPGFLDTLASRDATYSQARFVSRPVAGGRLVSLDGGTTSDETPDFAAALVRDKPSHLPEEDGIQVVPLADGLFKVEAKVAGVSGVTSVPAGNAIGRLVGYLWNHGIFEEAQRPFLEMERLIFASMDGAAIGISSRDTSNFGLCMGSFLRTHQGRFEQVVHYRTPQTMDGGHSITVLQALAHAHCCEVTLGA